VIAGLEMVAPSALAPHPDQRRIYGDPGGEHDEDFAEFARNVAAVGVHTPLLVSRGTPDLPDGTIISGHRRCAAALEAGLSEVPVMYQAFRSAAHAALAHLDCNRARVKDGWVLAQEAGAYWGVETQLAALRKAANGGKKTGGGTGTTSAKDKTRDAVAARLGESGKTAELRKRLYDKAVEQNPEDPSASAVAVDLKAGKAVKTVAREHGVLKTKAPSAKAASVPAQPSAAPANETRPKVAENRPVVQAPEPASLVGEQPAREGAPEHIGVANASRREELWKMLRALGWSDFEWLFQKMAVCLRERDAA
jgi:hypothetical protein